jgi:hypothetical protein
MAMSRQGVAMLTLRGIGLSLLAIAAVIVWFLMAPATADIVHIFDPTSKDYSDLVSTALDSFDANEALADSAPQQQVVNGWVARDLLTIIAYQNLDLLDAVGALGDQNAAESSSGLAVRDDRIPALLLLGVLALSWIGMTNPDTQYVYIVGKNEDVEDPQATTGPELRGDAPYDGTVPG